MDEIIQLYTAYFLRNTCNYKENRFMYNKNKFILNVYLNQDNVIIECKIKIK